MKAGYEIYQHVEHENTSRREREIGDGVSECHGGRSIQAELCLIFVSRAIHRNQEWAYLFPQNRSANHL